MEMKVRDRFPEGKIRSFDRLNRDQATGPVRFSTIGKSTSPVQNRASFSSTAQWTKRNMQFSHMAADAIFQ